MVRGDGHRLYGFLAGSTAAFAASYWYFLEEYKVQNELLTEDVDVCVPLPLLPFLPLTHPVPFLLPVRFISPHGVMGTDANSFSRGEFVWEIGTESFST